MAKQAFPQLKCFICRTLLCDKDAAALVDFDHYISKTGNHTRNFCSDLKCSGSNANFTFVQSIKAGEIIILVRKLEEVK